MLLRIPCPLTPKSRSIPQEAAKSNTRLSAMRVEVVDDQSKGPFGIGADHVVKILQKILFRGCLAKHRRDDLS